MKKKFVFSWVYTTKIEKKQKRSERETETRKEKESGKSAFLLSWLPHWRDQCARTPVVKKARRFKQKASISKEKWRKAAKSRSGGMAIVRNTLKAAVLLWWASTLFGKGNADNLLRKPFRIINGKMQLKPTLPKISRENSRIKEEREPVANWLQAIHVRISDYDWWRRKSNRGTGFTTESNVLFPLGNVNEPFTETIYMHRERRDTTRSQNRHLLQWVSHFVMFLIFFHLQTSEASPFTVSGAAQDKILSGKTMRCYGK